VCLFSKDMRTVSHFRTEATEKLSQYYDEREVANVIVLWFASRLGLNRTELVLKANDEIPFTTFHSDLKRLIDQEPIQHILGKSYFFDLELVVNQHTLVPRPETEELVEHVLRGMPKYPIHILDVGTGSGAIALALKSKRQDCEITAIDSSEEALEVAKANAIHHSLDVSFMQMDALRHTLPEVDLIVSNPPYIPEMERRHMERNVLEYEPAKALFVPDHDPLVFYKKIAEQAKSVAFEIHHDKGPEMRAMLVNFGYVDLHLFQDLQGRDRIITAHHESRRSY